jgi:hypothetical protein
MTTPINFSHEQLQQVMAIATPLSPQQRDAFMRALAKQLAGREPPYGNGDVHRAAIAAREAVLPKRAMGERG